MNALPEELQAITLDQQIEQLANQRYTPMGQAILDSLERYKAQSDEVRRLRSALINLMNAVERDRGLPHGRVIGPAFDDARAALGSQP